MPSIWLAGATLGGLAPHGWHGQVASHARKGWMLIAGSWLTDGWLVTGATFAGSLEGIDTALGAV